MKLGYATDSLSSALVMRCVDLLNPYKKRKAFYWGKKVRVSSTDGLGDLMIQLPLIEGLVREAEQRGADVKVVIRPAFAEIGRACGWEVVEFENPLQHFFKGSLSPKVFRSFIAAMRALRKERVDTWIDLSGNAVNALFYKLGLVKLLSSKISRGGKSLVDCPVPHEEGQNEYAYQRQVADFFHVKYTAEVKNRFDLPEKNPRKIVFSLVTAFPDKNWPMKYLRELIRQLPDYCCVLTGVSREFLPGDREIHDGICEWPQVESRLDGLDIMGLLREVATAGAIVTPDTGTAHIANFFGIPGVVLFGPTDSRVWGCGQGLRILWENRMERISPTQVKLALCSELERSVNGKLP